MNPGTAAPTAALHFREVVRPMRLAGATLEEIGGRLGVTRERARQIWNQYASDEDREALAAIYARRRRATVERAEQRRREAVERRKCRRREGADRVLRAMHDWHAVFGEPPSATDWDATLRNASPRALERYQGTHRAWPCAASARYHFGSWNAALAAAGYRPRERRWRRDV